LDMAHAMDADSGGWHSFDVPDRASTQAECDAIQAAARLEATEAIVVHPVAADDLPEPTSDLIEARLAEEIEYAQRLLEAVGDRFIADPLILQRHQSTMQSFDIIGQLLGHLAKVVGSNDKPAAIDRIGMQELRARLKRPAPQPLKSGTLG
jgi:hypothetical protein